MMAPSIYDYRGGEIENARIIRRERAVNIICAIIGTPIAVAAVVAFVAACAVL